MNKLRVAKLLASGIAPAQVASIVGCAPGRISQLLKLPEFELIYKEQLSLVEASPEESLLDTKYNAAEQALVTQVMEMAPVSELRDVTAALRVIAERNDRKKQRELPVPNGMVNNVIQTVVQISLPSHAIPTRTIEMTAQNEVISVGEQNLAPLPSDQVISLFSNMKKEGEHHEPKAITSEASSSFESPIPSKEVTPPVERIEEKEEMEGSFIAYAAS
jgi:hypothetical protein